MSNKSISTLKSKEYNHTIPMRMKFIQDLIKGKVEPIMDFDSTDTDAFIGQNKDNCRDIRYLINKKTVNFISVVNELDCKLEYIKSGTTGHTFKGIGGNDNSKDAINFAVKVVAYPMKDRYGSIYDVARPENAEIRMIKALSYFVTKGKTPHIVLPICTFNTSIKYFVNLIKEGFTNQYDARNKKTKYAEFVDLYKVGYFHNDVSVLISEWANNGDFLDFLRKKYHLLTLKEWKVFFFQIISVLAIIHSKFPSFRHNDLKANNILIHETFSTTPMYKYTIGNKPYFIPNIGYQIKIWDFDFACIPGIVDNKKVSSKWSRQINVTPRENKYYDIHYFFNTLIKKGFIPEIMSKSSVPKEVKEFILRIVPKKYREPDEKYVHPRGRILVNDEYTTPLEIISKDPFFDEFKTFTYPRKKNYINKNINIVHPNYEKSKNNINYIKKSPQRIKKSSNIKISSKKLKELLTDD